MKLWGNKMKFRKEITVFPEPYHATKLLVEGDSWEEVNQQIKKELDRIKHRLPKNEIELAEELI
jgi:hypothetical protein